MRWMQFWFFFITFLLIFCPALRADRKAADEFYNARNWSKALTEFENLSLNDPDDWYPHNRAAWCLYRLQQYEQAITRFEKANQIQKAYGNLEGIARCNYELGRYEYALELFTQCSKLKPGKWLPYNRMGWTLYYLKQYKDAIKHFEKSNRLKKQYGNYKGIGKCYYELDQYENAFEAFNAYARLAPDDWYPHNRMGWTLYYLEQYKDAVKHFEKSNTLKKLYGNYKGIGKCYYELDQYKNAFNAFKTYARLAPNDWYPHNRMGWTLYYLEQYKDAVKHFEKSNSLKKLDGNYEGIGKCYYELLQPDKAIRAFQQYAKLKPDDYYAHNRLGWSYAQAYRFKEALEEFKKANSMKKSSGNYQGIGRCLSNLGKIQAAEDNYKKAVFAAQERFGSKDPEISSFLEELGDFYREQGRYPEAYRILNQALALPFANSPRGDLDRSNVIFSAGWLDHDTGRFAEAQKKYDRCLKLRTDHLGEINSRVATCLNNLAILYEDLGQPGKAVTTHEKVLAIRKKQFGDNHPHIALSLSNLSGLYRSRGRLDLAEKMGLEALEMRKRIYGPEHLSVAESCFGCGWTYMSMRDFNEAEKYYKKALKIREKQLGHNHYLVATVYNNLGVLEFWRDNLKASRDYDKKALEIRRTALGETHPHTILSRVNLAWLDLEQGRPSRALAIFEQSFKQRERMFGRVHYRTAESLYGMARCFEALKKYDRAAGILEECIRIIQTVYGPVQPARANYLGRLGMVEAGRGNTQRTFARLGEALEVDNQLIDYVMGISSEQRKLGFLKSREKNMHAMISYSLEHQADFPDMPRICFNTWLRRKGLLLESQRAFMQAVQFSDNPDAGQIIQQLARVRGQLSKLVFDIPGKGMDNEYLSRIEKLKNEKMQLEMKLSRLSESFSRFEKKRKADAGSIAAVMPKNAALIDFSLINGFDLDKPVGQRRQGNRYTAFIMFPDTPDEIKLLDLGPASGIDDLIFAYKSKLLDPGDETGITRAAANLAKIIFNPLLEALKGRTELFVSPDGNLNLIPFEVLRQENGRWLVEDFTFNYLAAPRDLLGFRGEKTRPQNAPILMGAPDYDLTNEEKTKELGKMRLAIVKDKSSSLSQGFGGIIFSPLPETLIEAQTIARIIKRLKPEVYTGKQAVEEVLFKAKNPKFLHIATHGFFLENLGSDSGIDQTRNSNDPDQLFAIENPLLLSGLALAGANRISATRDAQGILTAEKILGLSLAGTDLVVLSACETGLGKIKRGEGVYGLRRAFTQAGTKSLVMSMWPVPDLETRELMVNFYSNLQSGDDRCLALRNAVRQELGILKNRYGFASPIHWGGFVFLGQR